MVLGTIWVQNIYLRLDTVVLLPNFEIAFAHISVKGSRPFQVLCKLKKLI